MSRFKNEEEAENLSSLYRFVVAIGCTACPSYWNIQTLAMDHEQFHARWLATLDRQHGVLVGVRIDRRRQGRRVMVFADLSGHRRRVWMYHSSFVADHWLGRHRAGRLRRYLWFAGSLRRLGAGNEFTILFRFNSFDISILLYGGFFFARN